MSGYVFGEREIAVTGVELRTGDTAVRAGLPPRTVIRGQGSFGGGGSFIVAVGTLTALVNDPSSVEIRILTEDAPDGLYRGRLKRAAIAYFAGFTHGPGANGWEVFLSSYTRDSDGRVDSIMMQNQISSIRGLSLQPVRGVYPWRVAIAGGGATLIDFGSPADESASAPGFPGSIMYGIDTRDEARRAAFEQMVANPGGFEVRTTPTADPGQVLTAPVRKMDRAIFHRRLGGPADSVIYLEVDFTRNEDGSVNSGIAYNISDWSTAAIRGTVQAVRLHSGGAGETGPAMADLATAQSGAPVGRFLIDALAASPSNPAAVGAIDRLVNYPDLTYIEASATGAANIRAQVVDFPGAPVIESIMPATQAQSGLAPGSLITIRGRRLAKITSGLDGWAGQRIPESLNGAIVQVGSHRAALLFVSPEQINAQIPFEATGETLVEVNHGTQASESRTIRIAPRAPSLFNIVEVSENVASVLGSGFGQSNPALETGRLVPANAQFRIPGVTASLGGQPAEVLDAAAVPGLPGLYQVRVRTGGRTGPLVVRVDGSESNAVTIR